MQYRSLVRFFSYAGIEPEDLATTSLSRMKKLAQAEFALQPDGVIVLDEISFTGNDILQELDRHDAQQRLEYHLLVWKHEGLLELLEQDHLDMDTMDRWYDLHRYEGFREFVSPYFAVVFHSAMNTLLHNRDLYNAAFWMEYVVFVMPEDEEQAVRSVRLFLEDALKLFRNLNDTSYRDRMAELEVWQEGSWSLLINRLPPSLAPYADELANAIINFTVRVQKVDPKLCYEISAGLMRLEHIDYSLKQVLLNNHDVYRKKRERGLFRMPSLYPVVIGIIILMRILMSIDFADNKSTGSYTVEDYQATMENLKYGGIRQFYAKQYSDLEVGGGGGGLAKDVVFSDKPVYLIIEDRPGDSLYPVALVNNTRQRINIDIISAGNVSNLVVGDHDVLGILPEREHTMDMILSFHQEHPGQLIVPATKDLQYLHVTDGARRPYNKLKFADGERVQLPVLYKNKLAGVPLIVTIYEREEGGYTFDVNARADVVNYRTLKASGK